MSLNLEFSIARTTLLAQESPDCKLVITNPGRDPVVLAAPVTNPDVPILRLTEIKTGIDTFQKGHPRHLGTEYVPLPGEKKIEHEFPLTSVAESLLPGEYEMAALVPYEMGLKRAESKPVKIKINPVTPRGLALTSAHDGWSGAYYGVSVNAASEPPQIVRHQFHIMTGGGVMDARAVANAHLRAAPALSTTPNGKVSHVHWIAWHDNGSLAVLHFNPDTGSSPVIKWKSAEPEFVIVPPLASEPMTDPAARPPGAALLWVGDVARHLSQFQVVEFGADGKLVLGARCDAGFAKPTWMVNHFRPDGTRLVVYAQAAPTEATTLHLRPWPKAGQAATAAKQFASWPGHCLGGGTLMMANGDIRGATLVRSPRRDGAKLELVVWKISVDGNYTQLERRSLAWGFEQPVSQAVIRLGPSGLPAAVLADADGKWTYFNPDGEQQALPPGLANTRYPLELTFLSEAQVVIIVGQMFQGFKVMLDDGEHLPHHGA